MFIPEHDFDPDCEYLRLPRGCYRCCQDCNHDLHMCPGCGEPLTHMGTKRDGTEHSIVECLNN